MKLGLLGKVIAPSLVLLAGIALAPPASAQGRRSQRPEVQVPRGAMRDVLRRNCSGCHGIDDYAYHALDKPGWTSLIETFCVSRGARFSGSDRDAILNYLVTNFGPTSKAFPRTYVPPDITTFFSDQEGNSFLEKTCAKCHSLQRVVDGTRRSLEGWRINIVNMREKGTAIGDQDVERLAEWLYRIRGTAAVDMP